mmetsp:Transcript_111371/g.311248  ORF Transcript_111371/g.311248 Transcript_111371/m.311248 type:complete len:277 (-) Transcript_111371:129-959(-)
MGAASTEAPEHPRQALPHGELALPFLLLRRGPGLPHVQLQCRSLGRCRCPFNLPPEQSLRRSPLELVHLLFRQRGEVGGLEGPTVRRRRRQLLVQRLVAAPGVRRPRLDGDPAGRRRRAHRRGPARAPRRRLRGVDGRRQADGELLLLEPCVVLPQLLHLRLQAQGLPAHLLHGAPEPHLDVRVLGCRGLVVEVAPGPGAGARGLRRARPAAEGAEAAEQVAALGAKLVVLGLQRFTLVDERQQTLDGRELVAREHGVRLRALARVSLHVVPEHAA